MPSAEYTNGREQELIRSELSAENRGNLEYEPYMYLWHLAAIGVLDVANPLSEEYEVNGALWTDAALTGRAAKVAIIDTGLASHPNLAGRVDESLSVDLGTDEGGAVYRGSRTWEEVAETYGLPGAPDAGVLEPRGSLPGLAEPGHVTAALQKLDALDESEHGRIKNLLGGRIRRGMAVRDLSVQDQRYPAHGTATAGLVVGAPVMIGKAFDPDALPYFGVDPFSTVFSIATSFEPEPVQLIFALIYALANDADVILMPRGIDNPDRAPRADADGLARRTRYDRLDDDWALLDRVLVAVSRKIPIVLAAGNDGDHQLLYPALLAAETSENGLITVGAVTAAGRRAGYSNYGEGLTLSAPSNDSRVYSRHQMRIDPSARTSSSHNFLIHRSLAGKYVRFSPEAPLTLDIPGPRGFRGASLASNPLSANYTLFSGTSAASAIVAGVVALMRRASSGDWSGIAVKQILRDCGTDWIFGAPLRYDLSNTDDMEVIGQSDGEEILWKRQFGAGLIDAKEAVARAAA